VTSIRDQVTGWSCGGRATARARERARRREALQLRKQRLRQLREAKAAKAVAETPRSATAFPLPTARPR
jgi:hypothetical protein